MKKKTDKTKHDLRIKKTQEAISDSKSTFASQLQALIVRFAENTNAQITALILVPLLIFLKVVNFEFILDDLMIIRNNVDVLSNLQNIGQAFTRDAFFAKPGTSFYRPIQTVSFMFDAAVSGANPWMYHFSNLIIHISTVIALYYLLRFFKMNKFTSFISSLLFSIHPLLACAIAWVPARGDLFIGFFGILMMLSFGYYFQTKKRIFYIAHVIFFVLAVFSKETALLFPLLLLTYYFLSLRVGTIKPLLKFIISWIITLCTFIIMKRIFVTENLSSAEFGFPALIRNLTIFPSFVSKIFLPVDLPLYPLFNVPTILSGLFFTIALAYYTRQLYKNKAWLPLMGIVWFMIFISAPLLYRQKAFEYVIITLEQRVYLPLIGLFIPLGFEIKKLLDKNKSLQVIITSAVVVLIYIGLAYTHADDYREPTQYANAAIAKNPGNAGAYTYLGFNCFEKQDLPGAFDNFTKAIEICQYPMAYFNRGAIKAAAGDIKGAESDFTSALLRDSTLDLCYLKRGSMRMQMGRLDEALIDLDHALKLNPTDPVIFNIKGKVLNEQHKYHDAIEEFSKAIKLAPAYIEPYEGRSYSRFNVRDFNGTVHDCNQILIFRPNDLNTYKNLGQAYREMKNYEKSILSYTIALKLDSTFAPAYFGRGLTKREMNDIEGWKADWTKASSYGYMPPQAQQSEH